MTEPSVGLWLRRERERRNITLQHIANQTKVAVPLLEGLEAGDLSRWPGGIYRRAFVKSYAVALGLDADAVVKRFEAEHPPETDEPSGVVPPQPSPGGLSVRGALGAPGTIAGIVSLRSRLLGTLADLTVAIVLSLGSAAAGSRLLWPVLFIAAYYAVGVLLTGTSPMVALLSDERSPEPGVAADPVQSADATPTDDARAAQRPATERRNRRVSRAQRASKPPRPHVQ